MPRLEQVLCFFYFLAHLWWLVMLAYLKSHFDFFRWTILLVHHWWRNLEIDCHVLNLRLVLLLRLLLLWWETHLVLDGLLWLRNSQHLVIDNILLILLELLIDSLILSLMWHFFALKHHLHVLEILHVGRILHVLQSHWVHIISHLRILHHHSLELSHLVIHTWHSHLHLLRHWWHILLLSLCS